MSKPKNHPYADLFPMMTAAELDALADDIKENGLRQPVVMYQKQVLDGRNRLLACEKAGVEPTFVEHEGDEASAHALVISLNVQRRDLTAGQRAITAAKVWMTNGDTQQRGGLRKTFGSACDIAKQFKSSEPSVRQARDLLTDAPDLAEQVGTALMGLSKAWEELEKRKKAAKQAAKDAERLADYKEAVSNGEMTWEEAMQKRVEEEREAKEKLLAEADSRKSWLTQFNDHLAWFEAFIHDGWTAEQLAWYTKPGSAGLFDHKITSERIAAVVEKLETVAQGAFGDNQDGEGKEDGRHARRPRRSAG